MPNSIDTSYLISLISSTLSHQLSLLPTPAGNLGNTPIASLALAYASAGHGASHEDLERRMRVAADMALAELSSAAGPTSRGSYAYKQMWTCYRRVIIPRNKCYRNIYAGTLHIF